MHSKTELGNLSPGKHFYFFNDPDRYVWTVMTEKRKAMGTKQLFRYCENTDTGEIQDWSFNREVYHINGKEDIPKELPVEKLPPVQIIQKPVPVVHKPVPVQIIHRPLNQSSEIMDTIQHQLKFIIQIITLISK